MTDLLDECHPRGAGRNAEHRRLRQELRDKLRRYDFTHFITLASNHQPLKYRRMRGLLKAWDARVNREINGSRWFKRPDERLVWFAFPEKFGLNAHWHLLVQVDPIAETVSRKERLSRMPEIAEKHWLNLVRQGSFDCQTVDYPKIIEYVTKMSADPEHFSSFILYREFMTD